MNLITRHRPAVLGIVLAGALAGAAVALGSTTSAAPVETTAMAAPAQGAAGGHAHPARPHAVTLDQARHVALSSVPGHVVLTSRSATGSGTVFAVTVARTDGSAVEVDVNAATGMVVATRTDSDEQPADRAGNHPEDEETATPAATTAPTVPEDVQRQQDRIVRHSGPQFRE
ncbi:MAG TPA: PepSY domain-containing protein [Oryzihumus sp.]|nr:PepSY domain-containing protein [Oryzihumus sp.]